MDCLPKEIQTIVYKYLYNDFIENSKFKKYHSGFEWLAGEGPQYLNDYTEPISMLFVKCTQCNEWKATASWITKYETLHDKYKYKYICLLCVQARFRYFT